MAALGRPTTQPQAPPQPVKSQRETDLENQLQLYEKEMQNLADKNYLASLKDDTFFRVELLSALNNIAMVMKNLFDKIEQLQQGGTQ